MLVLGCDNQTIITHSKIKRHMLSLFVSVLIVIIVLMIPVNRLLPVGQQYSVLEVKLSTVAKKPKVIEIPHKPKKTTQVVSKKKHSKKQKTIKKKSESISQTKQAEKKPPAVKSQEATETQLPKSGVIFESAYGKIKLHKLDESFQARRGQEDDFKFKSIEQPQWNQVTKLLNEEVDKPRLQMDFYSVGPIGSIEKFLDKYVPKKTFTTKYGTKIDCMYVGLVICGWK